MLTAGMERPCSLSGRRGVMPRILAGIVLLLAFFRFAGLAEAGLILDAELQLAYEDNARGSYTDRRQRTAGSTGGMGSGAASRAPGMGSGQGGHAGSGAGPGGYSSSGDFSTMLYAEAGGYRDTGRDTTLFAKGFASYTGYAHFTELDETVGGATAGISSGLGSVFSARATVTGRVRRFQNTDMNGTGVSGNLSVKERLTPAFRLKQAYDHEQYQAASPSYDYRGDELSILAGYALNQSTEAGFGYSYLTRSYSDASSTRTTSQSLSADMTWAFHRDWSVRFGYSHEYGSLSSSASERNNIFSVSLLYR